MTKNTTASLPGIISVAGFWELGWNTPIKEIELWEYPLRDFNVTNFFMTPVTGIQSPAVKERANFDEILKANQDSQVVFVDEKATVSLTNFTHPINALYVFGKASFSPMNAYKRPQDLTVKIDTPNNLGLLWPHQAAAIILYDRYLKLKITK